MKRLVVTGFFLVVVAEVVGMLLPDQRLVLWASGAAVALVLLRVRRLLVSDTTAMSIESDTDPSDESLAGWLSRTKTLIRWSESTRSDWDRHLRPILARQFAMATGQRQTKDPAGFQASGRLLFGPDLWQWINPHNVARTGAKEPGPGRATLDEILRRLEQI